MHRQHAAEGLAAISVAMDPLDDDPEGIKGIVLDFLKKKQATFTNLLLDEGSELVEKKLRFIGVPCVYVFDRRGRWTQFLPEGEGVDHQAIDRLVERLLKEK